MTTALVWFSVSSLSKSKLLKLLPPITAACQLRATARGVTLATISSSACVAAVVSAQTCERKRVMRISRQRLCATCSASDSGCPKSRRTCARAARASRRRRRCAGAGRTRRTSRAGPTASRARRPRLRSRPPSSMSASTLDLEQREWLFAAKAWKEPFSYCVGASRRPYLPCLCLLFSQL